MISQSRMFVVCYLEHVRCLILHEQFEASRKRFSGFSAASRQRLYRSNFSKIDWRCDYFAYCDLKQQKFKKNIYENYFWFLTLLSSSGSLKVRSADESVKYLVCHRLKSFQRPRFSFSWPSSSGAPLSSCFKSDLKNLFFWMQKNQLF